MGSTKNKNAYTASSRSTKKTFRKLDPKGLYERAGTWLLILPEQLAWYYNATYTGHTMKRSERGWFIVVRADFGSKKKVCFSMGETPTECVRHLAYDMRNGRTQWLKDKYP